MRSGAYDSNPKARSEAKATSRFSIHSVKSAISARDYDRGGDHPIRIEEIITVIKRTVSLDSKNGVV